MSVCEVQYESWGDHRLFVCETCRIKTLDRSAVQRRCRYGSHDPDSNPLTTSVPGLLGPDGDPLSQAPERPKPITHDL